MEDRYRFGVLRRQEREESRSRREGRQRQRLANVETGALDRLLEVADLVALVPVSNGELNAEIDANADEQHGEVD